MILPRYDYADTVRVIRNIHNDGTYPGERKGELLVKRGSVGYVQNVGSCLQDQIIYSVNFMEIQRVVGCRETELIGANEAWVNSQFEFRDHVCAKKSLSIDGEIVVESGQQGEIVKVMRDLHKGVFYHVLFGTRTIQVSELAIKGMD